MGYYEEQRIRELEKQEENHRFNCPRCGSTNWDVTSRPDFRFGNSASYGVKGKSCGHKYDVADLCTG